MVLQGAGRAAADGRAHSFGTTSWWPLLDGCDMVWVGSHSSSGLIGRGLPKEISGDERGTLGRKVTEIHNEVDTQDRNERMKE